MHIHTKAQVFLADLFSAENLQAQHSIRLQQRIAADRTDFGRDMLKDKYLIPIYQCVENKLFLIFTGAALNAAFHIFFLRWKSLIYSVSPNNPSSELKRTVTIAGFSLLESFFSRGIYPSAFYLGFYPSAFIPRLQSFNLILLPSRRLWRADSMRARKRGSFSRR